MIPRQITLAELSTVRPEHECFIIKNVVPAVQCRAIVNFLRLFGAKIPAGAKYQGENWRMPSNTEHNFFEVFFFNELGPMGREEVTSAYRQLFDLYRAFGEVTHLDDFEREIRTPDFPTDFRIINPLIFYYFAGKSFFEFHRHAGGAQAFQLLLNLTQPGVDYLGGRTWVYMGDGKPDLQDPALADQCVIFGPELDIGDVCSFPYHLWHRVETPLPGSTPTNARASLLMPLAPRSPSDYGNEWL